MEATRWYKNVAIQILTWLWRHLWINSPLKSHICCLSRRQCSPAWNCCLAKKDHVVNSYSAPASSIAFHFKISAGAIACITNHHQLSPNYCSLFNWSWCIPKSILWTGNRASKEHWADNSRIWVNIVLKGRILAIGISYKVEAASTCFTLWISNPFIAIVTQFFLGYLLQFVTISYLSWKINIHPCKLKSQPVLI